MPNNVGYMTADKTVAGDETFTPIYAVKPILPHLQKFAETLNKSITVWCPFDEEDSNYVSELTNAGYKVIASHIKDGRDFFEYEPEDYDVIISNPPFSKKDKVLERLYKLNKPYAMLLPLPTLQGQSRFEHLNGCQALIFDKRINYLRTKNATDVQKGAAFASIYICKNFLEKDLIFEKLTVS